jgi:hypothetical protein
VSFRDGPVTVQALLAESVAVADGRLFVQGAGWSTLRVPGLPAAPGRVGAGLLLTVPNTRVGQRIHLTLRLEGPDGEPLGLIADPDAQLLVAAEAEGALVAEAPPASGLDHQIVPLAFNLDGLRLVSDGVHALVVEVDGLPGARVPFAVLVEP